jgi:hypothetical protein
VVKRTCYSVTWRVVYCLSCFINVHYLIQKLNISACGREMHWKSGEDKYVRLHKFTWTRKEHLADVIKKSPFHSVISMNNAFMHVESRTHVNTTDFPIFWILFSSASSVRLSLYAVRSLPFHSYFVSYCYPLSQYFSSFPLSYSTLYLSCSSATSSFLFFVIFIVSQFFLFCLLLRHDQIPYYLFRTKATRKEIFW